MGVTYQWLMCTLNDSEQASLYPLYQQAISNARIPEEEASVIHQWQSSLGNFPRHHISVEGEVRSNIDCDYFNRAFVVNSFQNLWKEISTPEGVNGFTLNEKNCFEILFLSRYSPAAVFWYVLGPENAQRLPAVWGNFWASQDEVEELHASISDMLRNISVDKRAERIGRIIDETHAATEAYSMIDVILSCLESAVQENKGFFSLSSIG